MEFSTTLATDVRAADYDRFLAIQLAPAAKRPALYALTAFYAELARIAESVSEPLLGHIRLAWWREAVEEIIAGATPRNHPVVQALAIIHRTQPEVLPLLLPMIEARASDLDSSLLAEESAWIHYLDHTAGALHYAWALVLDAEAAKRHAQQIVAEARAYAMVGLARAIPYMASHGFLRFPAGYLEAAGIEDIQPGPGLAALVKHLLAHAAQQEKASWPRALRPLKGLSGIRQYHAQALARAGFSPYLTAPAGAGLVLRIMQVRFYLC